MQFAGAHRLRLLAVVIISLALLGLGSGLATRAAAQQPGPFTANDFQFSGPGQTQIPPHLYGPDLDGNTPSEVALSAGLVRTRLQRLGFHTFGSITFRNGYWNVVAFHGNKKRQLTVHPETGVIRSDKPYCNNRCNQYQLSEEF
ncbi:hypothetical protein [Microbulbifer aggregans]|uniref:hypothetical protein n=1 Tax=Microbulbifer aggregans TaxID=1769779 RepID=UPI001CFE29A0|nr:hypothetical protein [Microbulbifer aggregans]